VTDLAFNVSVANEPQLVTLSQMAGRIAQLLKSKFGKQPLAACLDDLLGAVYALMYAKHYEYIDRPQSLSERDVKNVQIRAENMAIKKVRTDGKWTAGFYLMAAFLELLVYTIAS
jgi:hypothetical protein